jgi:hypothetical protein
MIKLVTGEARKRGMICSDSFDWWIACSSLFDAIMKNNVYKIYIPKNSVGDTSFSFPPSKDPVSFRG